MVIIVRQFYKTRKGKEAVCFAKRLRNIWKFISPCSWNYTTFLGVLEIKLQDPSMKVC